jgi:hypothetical protein
MTQEEAQQVHHTRPGYSGCYCSPGSQSGFHRVAVLIQGTEAQENGCRRLSLSYASSLTHWKQKEGLPFKFLEREKCHKNKKWGEGRKIDNTLKCLHSYFL